MVINMSKEAKFTKGDWEVEWGSVVVINDCRFDVLNKHDAQLIKTAPKLYAALDEFISLVKGDSSEDFLYKYQEIKDLLAEARGE